MAAADPTLALQVPARLVLNPTQAGMNTGAFPHGGTELGLIAEAAFELEQEGSVIVAEEWGTPVGRVVGSEIGYFGFTLLQWDPDALALFYRTTTTSAGGFSGAKTLKATNPGRQAVTQPILVAPLDTSHPGLLIYAPVPYLGPARRRLDFSLVKGLENAVMLLATRDPNVGEPWAIDRIEHLSLT